MAGLPGRMLRTPQGLVPKADGPRTPLAQHRDEWRSSSCRRRAGVRQLRAYLGGDLHPRRRPNVRVKDRAESDRLAGWFEACVALDPNAYDPEDTTRSAAHRGPQYVQQPELTHVSNFA